MSKKIKMTKIIIFFVIFIISNNFSIASDISINQVATLKNDGSGKIDLTYSAKNTTIKNFMVGNYPFAPKVAEKRFTSANTKVESSGFYRSKNDTSLYNIKVIVDFQKLNNLNQALAFSEVKASWTNTDSGNVFKWVIPSNSKASAQITTFSYKFTFDGKVINSNGGKVEGNTITWYRDGKNIDPTKDIVLTALIESDGSESTNKTDGDGKSCGLFGFELPLIMLAGLVFSVNRKRKKSNK